MMRTLILLTAATASAQDSSTVRVPHGGTGHHGSMPLYRFAEPQHKPERWTYPAYSAAISLDYFSTRHALNNGASETVYRCNPHRAGCMNQAAFWTVAAIPVGMWLLHDLWLHKHTPPKWRRFERFARKLVIGGRAGVSLYNLGVATSQGAHKNARATTAK